MLDCLYHVVGPQVDAVVDDLAQALDLIAAATGQVVQVAPAEAAPGALVFPDFDPDGQISAGDWTITQVW